MKKIILVLLMAVSFSVLALEIDPTKKDVDLSWVHPTEYSNGSALPTENILKTLIERSSDNGATWLALPVSPLYPVNSYSDSASVLGEGDFMYRVYTVVVGNLVSVSSNLVTVTLFIPKSAAAPLLTVQ